jgi:hypothetical protein
MTPREYIEQCAERRWVLQPTEDGGVRLHGQHVPDAVNAILHRHTADIRQELLAITPETVAFLKWARNEAMTDTIPIFAKPPVLLPSGEYCANPKARLLRCVTHARQLAAKHGEVEWIQTEAGGEIYATWLALAWWWRYDGRKEQG